MANCSDVASFLDQVGRKSVSSRLAPGDLAALQQAGIVVVQGTTEFQAMTDEVGRMATAQSEIAKEQAKYGEIARAVQADEAKTHSFLFHLEGGEKKQAEEAQEAQDKSSLAGATDAMTKDIAAFNALVAKSALLQTMSPYNGQYIGLTGSGTVALRDLQYRLYRVSDLDFGAYWTQTQGTLNELDSIAARSADIAGGVRGSLGAADPSYVWAIAIGLAKLPADPKASGTAFLAAYGRLGSLTSNEENRLMAAELLAALSRPLDATLADLAQIQKDVRKAGVPKESSLGVSAILLAGQRADGTFATADLKTFLSVTGSYEAAALLTVVNRPRDDLQLRMGTFRGLFAQSGYGPSEDLELSSAFLTTSDLPAESAGPKLAVLTKGLGAYLEYPLVGAAILASIPILEAGETLRLVETTYEILGRRTGPMSQAALICLAVRAVHGVQVASVNALDPTAAARAGPVSFMYGRPGFFLVPIIVGHGAYYSTFSGIGGAHPGHVHAFGGAFIG